MGAEQALREAREADFSLSFQRVSDIWPVRMSAWT